MGKTIKVSGFPANETAEPIKDFLEGYTGKGIVEALEVKKPRPGSPKSYARVQFTTVGSAEYIISLVSQGLWYGTSHLTARPMGLDIVHKPNVPLHELESVILHFGCRISRDTLSVQMTITNSSAKFGYGLRKLGFFLSYTYAKYKLELSYDNILRIERRRPPGRPTQFLLIQLLGAPRIYKKIEESAFSFYKETPEDHWVRTIDFTPSSHIGQSSALCLEFGYDVQLQNFSSYFPSYQENEGPFTLTEGSSYSQNLQLVPIVGPPQGYKLPYSILFKVSMLVQNGYLPGPVLDINFFRLVDPQREDIVLIEHALEKLPYLSECCYDPVTWLKTQYTNYPKNSRPRKPAITLDEGLVHMRRMIITPSKVYFYGPEVNMSNRVLRNFREDIDNFLKISFVDEEFDKMSSTDLCPPLASSKEEKRTDIYRRILTILREGIVIGDMKFEFLAFSSSQLRENSVWMFASRPGLTAADIRRWMGDFSQIRNVAKYAARLGQSFGSSRETLSVASNETEVTPDIEVERGGIKYVFSDGIGKISVSFARRVAKKCGLERRTPSAFQIRYGGYKGVVAVDPTSSWKLSLRKSMCKYESENTGLDVLTWSKYQPCYLNRQLITLLSTLGVGDYIFEKKQREAISQLDDLLTDPLRAQETLQLISVGESRKILTEMLVCGYKPDVEPFLSMMLQTFRAAKLLELRNKTRIFVREGRSMMGCLDETRSLEYGQVFVQYSSKERKPIFRRERHKVILKGKVVVAKNPCLHPGDVRVLKAVDVPALHHMVDCVVFPQKGRRPHPNECSGSDLDGDIYFVSWDPDLIPRRQVKPMDYTTAPSILLDHDVTIEEVEEYFANYIVNDSLGIIANAHTVFADREPLKAMSDSCIQLAKIFSIAVDFPKTGVPAEIPSHLHAKEYPDFMDKPPDMITYESKSVIGKLFREVRDIAPQSSSIKSFFTKEVAEKSYDVDMEVDGFEDFLDDAFDYKKKYDFKLGNLMDYYGIKTEAELLGGIIKMSRTFDKKRDFEAIGLAVTSLRKEARKWFNSKSGGSDVAIGYSYAKASAWYHVTYHPNYWGRYNEEGMKRDHFLSFPWCVYDKLVLIKKNKLSFNIAIRSPSLEEEV